MQGKKLFDVSQYSIQKSLNKAGNGSVSGLKVKLLDYNKVNIGVALEAMVKGFESLSPKEQKNALEIVSTRLKEVKDRVRVQDRSGAELLDKIMALEERVHELAGSYISPLLEQGSLSPFQSALLKKCSESPLGHSGAVHAQEDGTLLLTVKNPHLPTRYFQISLNKRDNTLILKEPGNPKLHSTFPYDDKAWAHIQDFQKKISADMEKVSFKQGPVDKELHAEFVKVLTERNKSPPYGSHGVTVRVDQMKDPCVLKLEISCEYRYVLWDIFQGLMNQAPAVAPWQTPEGRKPTINYQSLSFECHLDTEKRSMTIKCPVYPLFVRELPLDHTTAERLNAFESEMVSLLGRKEKDPQFDIRAVMEPSRVERHIDPAPLQNNFVDENLVGVHLSMVNCSGQEDARAKLQKAPPGTYLFRNEEELMNLDGRSYRSWENTGVFYVSFIDSQNRFSEIRISPHSHINPHDPHPGYIAEQVEPSPKSYWTKFVTGVRFESHTVDTLDALFKGEYLAAELKSFLNGEGLQEALGKQIKKTKREEQSSGISKDAEQAFWGEIDTEKAKVLIAGFPAGAYMILNSKDPLHYTLFYSQENGKVGEIVFEKDPALEGKLKCVQADQNTIYENLSALVADQEFSGLLTNPIPPFHSPFVSFGRAGEPLQIALPGRPQGPKVDPKTGLALQEDFRHPDLPLFVYPWGKEPFDPGSLEEIDSDKLVGMHASGARISADQFFAEAEKMVERGSANALSADEVTTLHTLYDKAAELYQAEGNILGSFQARKRCAEEAAPSAASPFFHLDEEVKKRTESQKLSALGAHFSGADTGIVRGGHVRFFKRNIEGKEMLQMYFKTSFPARQQLQQNLMHIVENGADFESLLPEHLQGKVRISKVHDCFLGKDENGVFSENKGLRMQHEAIQVEFEGVGAVVIGNNPKAWCLYNTVKVLVSAGQNEGVAQEQIHQMLTMLGLGPVLNQQREGDDKRILVATLLRDHFPREALRMQRTKEFYELPLADLISKIEEDIPPMRDVLRPLKMGNLPSKVEIVQGRDVWKSEHKMPYSGFGLFAGVGGAGGRGESTETVVKILKSGMLSGEERFLTGLFGEGASPSSDLEEGGGDSVFTRFINQKLAEYHRIPYFEFHGEYQLLIAPEATSVGAYNANGDTFGSKNPFLRPIDESSYENRSSMQEFYGLGNQLNRINEVMIKNFIDSSMIRGIVCQDQSMKRALIHRLAREGMISGWMINGKPVDQFIKVQDTFDKDSWA